MELRGEAVRVRAEAFSIRRLEGSRWRLRRTRHLWGLKAALVPILVMAVLLIAACGALGPLRRRHDREPAPWKAFRRIVQ